MGVFNKYCPSKYVNDLAPLPSPIIDNKLPISVPLPWNGEADFDEATLTDLKALGWGDTEKLKEMLMSDKIAEKKQNGKIKKGKNIVRVDRALYVLFQQRKIKRVGELSLLSPKAIPDGVTAFNFQRDFQSLTQSLEPYRAKIRSPEKANRSQQMVCDKWGCSEIVTEGKLCPKHINSEDSESEFKMDFNMDLSGI